MSFELHWELLRDGVEAGRLKTFMNERFAKMQRPSFLGPVTVADLDFGDIPPEITIVDICDPMPEFYVLEYLDVTSDHDSRTHEQWMGSRGSSAGFDAYSVAYDRPPGMGAMGDPLSGGIVGPYLSSSGVDMGDNQHMLIHAAKQDTDVQLELLVNYHGNMRLTITTELIVNQPTPAFMVLPLSLSVRGFSFEATAVIAYLGHVINFCLKELENGDSILREMTIESEVGDKNKQVLKNVGKIEKFIVQQLKKIFSDFLVFPNYHSLYLMQEGGSDAEDGQGGSGESMIKSPSG